MTRREQKKIENELMEYYYATKEKKRLMIDLDRSQAEYDDRYEDLYGQRDYEKPNVQNGHTSDTVPYAAIALLAVKDDTKKYKKRISQANCTIERITTLVAMARLTGDEREYVRLRHFEGLEASQVLKKMHIASSTCARYRATALDKIRRVR